LVIVVILSGRVLAVGCNRMALMVVR
jgi:hypothetical protein